MKIETGQWILWSTPYAVKQGEVIAAPGPSLVVRWLGGTEQVFPTYEGYVPPYGGAEYRMEIIPRPPKASVIERDTKRGVTSIAVAAARLGTTPKRVRAMIRGGQLRGIQENGRWVSVELNDESS